MGSRAGRGPRETVQVVGVDGCRGGWIAVALLDGRFAEARAAATLADVLARFPDAACVGVDMPVGLLDAGWREADRAARDFLGPRRSAIFPTPSRPVLAAATHAEAVAVSRRLDAGKGISRQSHALRAKILEVDAARDDRLHEVHPEVSFALLAGAPLSHSKKTWAGLEQRRVLLAGAGIVVPAELGAAGKAAPDDVLDAAAAAWSAARVAACTARRFPPERAGAAGRMPAIWA